MYEKEDFPDATIEKFIAGMRATLPAEYAGMISELEETLKNLKEHPEFAEAPDSNILIEVMANAVAIPMYDDGIEEHLTRTLTAKFGITSIRDLEPQKLVLAGMICAVRLVERESDIKQVLRKDYGLTDAQEIDSLTGAINLELRWEYNGDVQRFFKDLEGIPKGDIWQRIRALANKNIAEGIAGTSDLPRPEMVG